MGAQRGFITGIKVFILGGLLMLIPIHELFREPTLSQLETPYRSILEQFEIVFPAFYMMLMFIGIIGGISFSIGAVVYLIKGKGARSGHYHLRLTRQQGHVVRTVSILILSGIIYFNHLLVSVGVGAMLGVGGSDVILGEIPSMVRLWGDLYQRYPMLYQVILFLIIAVTALMIFAALFTVDINHIERRATKRVD